MAMVWYEHLYLGAIAAKKQYKILRKINKRWLSKAYAIILPANPENVLEVCAFNELLQKHYAKHPVFIVGLAYGKDEAMELLQDIIMDFYRKYGSVKVADYITQEGGM